MARYETAITDDVRDVLVRSEITATAVKLPAGQLARDLYARVDKVLKAAGGKWNRSAGAHVFSRDPRAALGLALDTGAIVDERKALQQFFTPSWLAEQVCDAAGVGSGHLVLEPSAGGGAIAQAARARLADVHCVEIDRALANTLQGDGFVVVCQDFTKVAVTHAYDRVVMNPPFTGGQGIDHVMHAFSFLRTGGVLAAILPGNVMSKSTTRGQDFCALVDGNDGAVEDLPEDSFIDAGTRVRTVLVTIPKGR